MENSIAMLNKWYTGLAFKFAEPTRASEPDTAAVPVSQLMSEQMYASEDSIFESLVH